MTILHGQLAFAIKGGREGRKTARVKFYCAMSAEAKTPHKIYERSLRRIICKIPEVCRKFRKLGPSVEKGVGYVPCFELWPLLGDKNMFPSIESGTLHKVNLKTFIVMHVKRRLRDAPSNLKTQEQGRYPKQPILAPLFGSSKMFHTHMSIFAWLELLLKEIRQAKIYCHIYT